MRSLLPELPKLPDLSGFLPPGLRPSVLGDPLGLGSPQLGVKSDDAKLDFGLIDDHAEAEMVAVLTFGAAKYEPGNWRHVEAHRYFRALRRHLFAFRTGERLDPETGLHHLACAACCVHFLLGLELATPAGLELRKSLPERLKAAVATGRRLKAERLAGSSATLEEMVRSQGLARGEAGEPTIIGCDWSVVGPRRKTPIAKGFARTRELALRAARRALKASCAPKAKILLSTRLSDSESP